VSPESDCGQGGSEGQPPSEEEAWEIVQKLTKGDVPGPVEAVVNAARVVWERLGFGRRREK